MLAKFTLNGSDGPISVNPNHVVAMRPEQNGTVIICVGSRNGMPLTFTVKEPFDQVERTLNGHAA